MKITARKTSSYGYNIITIEDGSGSENITIESGLLDGAESADMAEQLIDAVWELLPSHQPDTEDALLALIEKQLDLHLAVVKDGE